MLPLPQPQENLPPPREVLLFDEPIADALCKIPSRPLPSGLINSLRVFVQEAKRYDLALEAVVWSVSGSSLVASIRNNNRDWWLVFGAGQYVAVTGYRSIQAFPDSPSGDEEGDMLLFSLKPDQAATRCLPARTKSQPALILPPVATLLRPNSISLTQENNVEENC